MIDQRELYDAIIAGAKASKYGRDLEHPDGDLSVFFANVCNTSPAAFLMLFGELIQQEVQTEPREPQHAETNVGRLQ
jgi:hypothetical protein